MPVRSLLAALTDLPVVVLTGMRQTGKSTLLTSTKQAVRLGDKLWAVPLATLLG